MFAPKILEIIHKYADNDPGTVVLEESKSRFQHQRNKLSEFSNTLQSRMRIILHEMEGEIFTLRERQFDRKMLKMLITLWNSLIEIYKIFNKEKPYETASQLVDYVHSKNIRAIIENLDFLANHHLEQTKAENDIQIEKSLVGHSQIRSLALLISLADWAKKYMSENPLLPIPQITPVRWERPTTIPTPIPPEARMNATIPITPSAKKETI